MPRPEFLPLGLLTDEQKLARRQELAWLFELDAPRKPRRSREGTTPPPMSERERQAFGILPEDE